MNTKYGECIQDRICSYGSNSPTFGAYCKVESTIFEATSLKNYFLDSTITLSGDENNNGQFNIYMMGGKINMKSINVSNSKLVYSSIYNIYCGNLSNVTYSTFSNNTSEDIFSGQAYHAGYQPQDFGFQIFLCN